MPESQAIDISAIRDFLGERGYKIVTNWRNTDIWRKKGGAVVWECQVWSSNEGLKQGLNHWLCEQLGIHWDKKLWQSIAYLFESADRDAIEKAIAWHDAFSSEDNP